MSQPISIDDFAIGDRVAFERRGTVVGGGKNFVTIRFDDDRIESFIDFSQITKLVKS